MFPIPEGITMWLFRSVVCAGDFSETSQEAFAVAQDIASCSGARLHLVHAVIDPLQLPWSVETAAVVFAELLRSRIQGAEEGLSKLAASLPADHGTEPQRPRLSEDGMKCVHCSRRIRFIRFDRRMM
jgi:hypothetical protein